MENNRQPTEDVDLLISLVKDRPVIWDKTNEGYRNKDLTYSAWEEIYKTIYPSFEKHVEEKKKAIGKQIQKKWTHLRDNWRRTFNKQRDAEGRGESFKEPRKFDRLKFLIKVYKDEDRRKMIFPELFEKNSVENPVDPDAETVINFKTNAYKQQNITNLNKTDPINDAQTQNTNISTQKRKAENIDQPSKRRSLSTAAERDQDQNVHPLVINVGHGLPEDIPSVANKLLQNVSKDRSAQKTTQEENEQPSCSKQVPFITQNAEHEQPSSSGTIKQEVHEPVEDRNSINHNPTSFSEKTSVNPQNRVKNEEDNKQNAFNQANIVDLGESSEEEEDPSYKLKIKKKSPKQDNKVEEELKKMFEILLPMMIHFDNSQLLDCYIEFFQIVKKIQNSKKSNN